ncbi:MAG: PEGA domain-containing protein [Candidatus Doudnabacteria bacterium]|nr:PEGA domain-containing protein [Candidatus Doudnabacteria bacterium]
MTLRNRFLLIAIGVLFFILTTPIITLYALGYKFDLHSRQILKTGSLVLKSEPHNANVYINDKLQSSKTNSTIRFLLPGDFNIKIAKEGYQSWTKRLNIRSSLVTWANHDRDFITLFFENPKQELSETVSLNAISLQENRAIIVKDNTVSTYNPNKGTFENGRSFAEKFSSPISVASQEMEYFLLAYPITQYFSPELILNLKHLESNNSYAAILSANSLNYVKNQSVIKLADNVSGFHLENEHLWYMQGPQLNHANLSLGVIEPVGTLNYTPLNSEVIRGQGRIFILTDQTLYMLNDDFEQIYRGVNHAYWDTPTNRLVFSNNNEVLTFDPGSFKTDLIVRSSSTIHQPIINSRTGYLFFLNEDKLKAIELDGRDHRNVYTITATPARSFLLSEDGKLATLFTETQVAVIRIRE